MFLLSFCCCCPTNVMTWKIVNSYRNLLRICKNTLPKGFLVWPYTQDHQLLALRRTKLKHSYPQGLIYLVGLYKVYLSIFWKFSWELWSGHIVETPTKVIHKRKSLEFQLKRFFLLNPIRNKLLNCFIRVVPSIKEIPIYSRIFVRVERF